MKWLFAILTIGIQIALIFYFLSIAHEAFALIAPIFSVCAGLYIKFSKGELKRKKEIAFGLLVGTAITIGISILWISYFLTHRCC